MIFTQNFEDTDVVSCWSLEGPISLSIPAFLQFGGEFPLSLLGKSLPFQSVYSLFPELLVDGFYSFLLCPSCRLTFVSCFLFLCTFMIIPHLGFLECEYSIFQPIHWAFVFPNLAIKFLISFFFTKAISSCISLKPLIILIQNSCPALSINLISFTI